MARRIRYTFFSFTLLLISFSMQAQSNKCDSITPSFTVDLTGDPNAVWISPNVKRQGHCCNYTGNVTCIEFIITLDPKAEGVIFDIHSGAKPSGALYYQLGCGAPTSVGTPLCLSGGTTDTIRFCKPGGNTNEYSITSVAEPVVPDTIAVNDGCSKQLGVLGFDESTISWNSVSGPNRGTYNSYLSCDTACDTVLVTPSFPFPDFVDYEVCGLPFGGCDSTWTCDTVRVNFFSTLGVDILPEFPVVCLGDTGTWIRANPRGGSPPYVYNWSTGDTLDSIFVNTGSFTIELGDTSGCPPAYDTVLVTTYTLPIEAIAGNDTFSCEQNFPIALNGSVVSAGGGTWIGNGTILPDPDSLNISYTPTATEIANGNASLRLITRDHARCPADTDLINIGLFNFDAAVTTLGVPVSCKGSADGVAIASATGTRAPYSYLWDAGTGGQVGDSAMNLPADTYMVTMTDTTGCTLDTTVVVIEADSVLTLGITTSPVTCFSAADGFAILDINGGMPPYSVTWDNAITVSNDTSASSLITGTYTVNLTDSFGCTIDTSFVIDGPLAPLTAALTRVNVGCKNGNDGTATATPAGGTAPYTYQWDTLTGSQTTPTAINLSKGTYEVTVTDSMGCTFTDTISLNEPVNSISYTDSTTSPSCFGGNDGTATVFPTGGTPPYTYLWDTLANSQTTQTATGLFADTFSVIIFDQNSCVLATPVIVTNPPELFATTVEITHVTCKGGANGSAKVTATGGTGPYTFLWDTAAGSQTDSVAVNLKAGTYGVTVNDQNGCSFVPDVTILEPSDSLIINTSSITVSCKGGSDGIAIGIASGGTLPYTITWDAATGSQTGDTASGLSTGTYTITVIDSNNCQADSTVFVDEPVDSLLAAVGSTVTSCYGDSDGVAYTSVVGGFPPYTIQWDTNAFSQVNDSAYGLPAGNYTAVITDTNNCSLDIAVSVLQPSKIIASGAQDDIDCFGFNTGMASILASGGTGPYSFQWDTAAGSQTTDTAFNLTAGTYTVVVSDNNGCSEDSTFTLTQPASAVILGTASVGVTCFGETDGLAIANASGGTPPYSYQWGAGTGLQTTDTAFNLTGGSYSITVTDSLGCSDNNVVTVAAPAGPLTSAINGQNVTCFNGTNGMAWSNVTGGTFPYTYFWTYPGGSRSTDTATSLPADSIFLYLTDLNGCELFDTIFLTEPDEVMLEAVPSATICIGDSSFIATVASSGNGAPYTFEIIDSGLVTPPIYVTPDESRFYGIRAYDRLGCPSQIRLAVVDVRDLPNETLIAKASGDVCLNDTVVLSTEFSGTFGDETFEWNTGQNSQSFPDVPLQSQYYTVTVSDICDNKISDSVFVTVFPLPELDLDSVIKRGCVPLTVQFSNDAIDPEITDYLWTLLIVDEDSVTSIDPNPVLTYDSAGEFEIYLELQNRFGCKSETSSPSYVIAYPNPDVGFTSRPSLADMRNPVVEFTSTSDEGAHRWEFDNGDTSTLRDPTYTYADTGIYYVQLRVTDGETGCFSTITDKIIIEPFFTIEVPNAFTPNPSGSSGGKYDPTSLNNYVFFPQTEGVEQYKLQIFNRWGELIFESVDHRIGWDGYYRGQLVAQEVYVWKLDIVWENGQTYEGIGDVTLFR